MKNKNIEDLKRDYLNTSIPEELEFMVEKTIREEKRKMNKKNDIKRIWIPIASVAAAFTIMVAGINTSPVLAESLGELPILGNVVRVLTFREYNIEQEEYGGKISAPKIEGLEDQALEDGLNKKYLEENKELYEGFMEEIEVLEKEGGGHLTVNSGYQVKTDTDEMFSIGRYTESTQASTSTEIKYDTVSKIDNILISLPSLFKDDKYIKIISENIKDQMIESNKDDKEKVYWIKEIESDVEYFEAISKEQSFYINSDNKLMISFDKYEVAPGYMGVVEFEIPTQILLDQLVSNRYIK